DPGRTASYTNLAALQIARGERQGAEVTFKKAAEMDPRSIPARLALVNFYWSGGRYADADRVLKQALALDPNDVKVNPALAMAALIRGDAAGAERYLKAVVANAGDLASQLALADYYIAVNRGDEAEKVLAGAADKPNAFAPMNIRRAVIAFSAKQPA